jgi:hypothetical protein
VALLSRGCVGARPQLEAIALRAIETPRFWMIVSIFVL